MDDDKAPVPSENNGSEIRSALRGLISFFTIWHLDITQRDMDNMDSHFHLVPVVGMLFAAVLMVEAVLFEYLMAYHGFGYGLVPVFAIATVYIGSKFLHFDGLTDFGDGMIASGDREKHIRALKDTLVGAGGVGVGIITVLLALAVYGAIPAMMFVTVIPLMEVLVKNAQVFAAARGIPGNGMAGRQVSMTNGNSAVYSFILSLALGIILVFAGAVLINAFFGYYSVSSCIEYGLTALFVGLIVSSLVGIFMAKVANNTFGMVNGDILGATNEISRVVTAFFIALAIALVL